MNVLVIAGNTYREGIRKKTLIGFLIVALLVMGSSVFLTTLSPGEEIKMIKDVCLTAVALFGTAIAVFMSGSAIPNEVESKTIHTIVSKPLRRYEYVLGKFMGVQYIILLNLALMAGLFLIILYVKERVLSLVLLKAIFLTYFELMIISAFTFAVSVIATSSALPIICGFFIYITGNLTQYLKGLADHARSAGNVFVGTMISIFQSILPNLSEFNIRLELIHGQPNDPTFSIRVVLICIYGLSFVLAGLILAYWLFRREEL